MVVQKQRIPINFQRGIDTKTDSKQLPIGSFLALENCVFDKTGKISKRNGYEALPRTIANTGESVQSGNSLVKYKDDLLLLTKNRAYSFDSNSQSWVDKGYFANVSISENSIIKNSYGQTNPCAAMSGNTLVVAYEDSRGGVRYCVRDVETQATIVNDVSISTSASFPRLATLNSIVYVFYVEAGTIRARTINVSSPLSISSESTIITDIKAASPTYDCKVISGKIYIGYNYASDNQVKLVAYDGLTVTGPWLTTITANGQADNGVSICATQNNGVRLAFISNNYYSYENICDIANIGSFLSTNNTMYSRPVSMSSLQGIQTFDLSSGENITLYSGETAYGTPESTQILIDGAATTHLITNLTVASSIVEVSDRIFIHMHNGQFQQYSNFLCELSVDFDAVSATCNVIGKSNYWNAGRSGGYKYKQPYLLTDNDVNLYTVFEYGSDYNNPTSTSVTGLSLVSTHLDYDRLQFAEINDNLTVASGVVKSYDGAKFTEHSFYTYPTIYSATTIPGTGSLSTGSYSYIAVYEWTDNLGQIHRSTTSTPVQVSAAASDSVTFEISTYPFTDKSDVRIELYRTKVAGSVYYKVTSKTSPLIASVNSYYVTYNDTLSDSTIASREYIYTSGRNLDNFQPPSAKYICTHKGRIFLAGTTNPYEIMFSKLSVDGEPTSFAAENSIIVDSFGGPITGIASNGQYLLVFKESAIYALSGEGPINTGEQNDYNSPEQISYDIGAISDNAIVNTPDGIFFKSKKGIYVYSGALSYIGAPVEEYNDYTINASTLVSDKNEVRFTTNEGTTLVYNYYFKQWSTFTNQASVDSIYYDSTFHYLNQNGTVLKETTLFSDNGSFIPLRMVTGWLSFAGISNYQRFKKLFLVGEYKSPHYLNVSLGYDFNDAFIYTQTIRTQDIFADGYVYGSGSYGSESPYGGDGYAYHLECNTPIQKCSSIRIKIEDAEDNVIGESFSLSNLNLEVGIKPSGNKLASNQRF